MPHMFTNRTRLYNLTKDSSDLKAQFCWETLNAVLYKLGGLVFITGSILFFPSLERYTDLGAWTFLAGSLLYLVVTVHDWLEVLRNWRLHKKHSRFTLLERIAASSYVWGTVLFTVGSVFFLSSIGWTIPGAWCFVFGSLLFVTGASVNVLHIIKSRTIATMQLMNLTAVSFVVGSVLFTVASIPYLWSFQAQTDQTHMFRFLAWQYLVGSILFFLGGVTNYWRAYRVVKEEIAQQRKASTSGS
ncbi:MAG: YrhK family protein [Desulfovibrionaceae bacterium]